jgi:hypothetical protein
MATQILTGPATSSPALFISPPVGLGLQVLHLLNSSYVSGTSLKNLASPTAAASTIVGNPTKGNSYFTVVTPGTDEITLSWMDTGGDITFYGVMQNLDTLAGNTTQPVIVSNFGADAAHGSVPGGNKGTTFRAASTTTVQIADYQLISGSATNKSEPVTVTSLSSAWKAYACTIGFAGSTTTLTIYDLTDNGIALPPQNVVTGVTSRAWNAQQALRLFANQAGTNYGLCNMALFMGYQTANGAGGAHTAAQVAATYAFMQQQCLLLPSPITI